LVRIWSKLGFLWENKIKVGIKSELIQFIFLAHVTDLCNAVRF